MSVLVSSLSSSASVTFRLLYTFPVLISNITDGEITQEEVKPEWIEWAMGEIDSQTGLSLRSPFTDKLDGNDLITIFTRKFPLIEVSKVLIGNIEVPPSAYCVNERTGRITLKNDLFPEGCKNITVIGISGYREVPPLIQKIASLLVAKTALSAKHGHLVDNESIGDFTQTRTFKKLNDELDRAWEALGKRFPIDFI